MPSFNQAFAEARKAGKKTFTWNGKLYSTALKGEGQTGNRGGSSNGKRERAFRSRNEEMEEEGRKKPIVKKRKPETVDLPEPQMKGLEQRADNTQVYKPQPVKKKKEIPRTRDAQTSSAMKARETKPWELGRRARQKINSNPALALADKKFRGKVSEQGTEYTDADIPIEQYNVLSDQNQYIWDNISSVLSSDISRLQSELGSVTNLARRREIEKTIKSKQHYLDMARKGILRDYLLLHPDEKLVVGGNFRQYKDANQGRFPKGTPTGYAGFGKDRYLEWAMKTPLGQTETIWGSAIHSYQGDPVTQSIRTAVSDTYDFNPYSSGKSNEGNLVGQLRLIAGKDPSLGEGSSGRITRRMNLRPIIEGQSNYITDPNEFGVLPEEADPFYGKANDVLVPLLTEMASRKK